jgi:Protein similar to CwfJ C-terminus 1/Protein similar to CwfJ C-terminus 2
MDDFKGLEDFEKALAAEKVTRDKEVEKHSKHRHHHHHQRRLRHREREDEHKHKRSRHSRGAEDGEGHSRHSKTTDPKEALQIPDGEEVDRPPDKQYSKRDSWMTAPSALDFDYTRKGAKIERPKAPSRPDYDLKIHKNELNHRLRNILDGDGPEEVNTHPSHYDLSAVTQDLPLGLIMEKIKTPALDQTALNRLRAQMMKAKLKGAPEAATLEQEYNEAVNAFAGNEPEVVTLGVMENRMLAGNRGEVKSIDNKRGRERGLVEQNDDMSVQEMVQEERRTKGQAGGESRRFAERIAKDAKFQSDLDYLDDNSNKLAKHVQKSEINLKNTAISEYQKINRILDSCPLCHHEDKNQPPAAPLISLATRVYLTLPTEPELSEGGAVIVPIQHRTNLLECDDDEWEEIRNFMKCLTRMYHDQGRDVVFYENAAAPQRKLHAAMQVVPLPYSLGETAPAFFKEAILTADEEWSQHKKLIDTTARARDGLGKVAFRRSIAKEMPYVHVWFELDGGLGHIVEDSSRWPKGDLFVREIIGGMLDLEPDIIRRQGRWTRGIDRRSEGFKKRWRKFDWTRVLTDGQ